MADIKDLISDLVKHVVSLKGIDHIKLDGTGSDLQVHGMIHDTLVFQGKIHGKIDEFNDEIGMGNFGFLSALVSLKNYKENGKIKLVTEQRSGVKQLDRLVFSDDDGNTDQYRFMGKSMVNQLVKTVKFRGAEWQVTVSPTQKMVQTFETMNSLYGGIEPNFTLETENKQLIVKVLGQQGDFTGKRVLAKDIKGQLTNSRKWPLQIVIDILKLGMSGTCLMQIDSESGALMITMDSGIGEYRYILPAQQST